MRTKAFVKSVLTKTKDRSRCIRASACAPACECVCACLRAHVSPHLNELDLKVGAAGSPVCFDAEEFVCGFCLCHKRAESERRGLVSKA